MKINKRKILGRGATATIYEAENNGKLFAAKIYHSSKKIDIKKIEAMMDNPPIKMETKIDGINFQQFAWPEKFVTSDKGEIIGFLMPLIDLKNSFSLDCFYDKILFSKLNSKNEVALTFRLAIARNLSKVVSDIHHENHHFIDLKPQNIRVYKGTHAVTLLDCDGFSIQSKKKQRFSADLISTDYISPEATQNNMSPKEMGEKQDLYALAVILFQLLNNGTHPFQGILKKAKKANTNDEKAAQGLYPHGLVSNVFIKPRPQSIHHTWLESTRKLFDLAFTGTSNQRPSASDWANHFEDLLNNKLVVRCHKVPNSLIHLRFKNMKCPACYLEDLAIKSGNYQTSQRKTQSKGSTQKKYRSSSASSTKNQPSNWPIIIFVIALISIVLAVTSNDVNNGGGGGYSDNSNLYKKNGDIDQSEEIKLAQEKIIDKHNERQKRNNSEVRDCRNVKGKCSSKQNFSSGIFEGVFLDGYPRKGLYTSDTGEKYKGEFNNKFEKHGKGIFWSEDGRLLYDGSWNKNKWDGQGTAYYYEKNGAGDGKYTGSFKNDMEHGSGTIFNSDGRISYKGDVAKGKVEGYGILYFYDEGKKTAEHEGLFKDNEPNGWGTLTYVNSKKWQGEWKAGKLHGYAVFFDSIGNKIEEGEYENGEMVKDYFAQKKIIDEENRLAQEKRRDEEYRIAQEKIKREHNLRQKQRKSEIQSGNCERKSGICKGELNVHNGRYFGLFLNGKPHGRGTFYHKNGDIMEANQEQGLFQGQGKYTYANGNWIEGSFVDDYIEGFGIFYIQQAGNEGDRIEGVFRKGELVGEVIYYWGSGNFKGDKWKGQIKNRELDGKGSYTRANGETLTIYYKNGKPDTMRSRLPDWLSKEPEITPSNQNSMGR